MFFSKGNQSISVYLNLCRKALTCRKGSCHLRRRNDTDRIRPSSSIACELMHNSKVLYYIIYCNIIFIYRTYRPYSTVPAWCSYLPSRSGIGEPNCTNIVI